MLVLAEYTQAEIEVKKSRFLAEVIPVTSQQEARQLLKQQKLKYTDASHVVHAFVAGFAAEVMGCSDDGEPSGTAGRPVLDVLKGRNCTNILLTVTRWFGGTLLGTGGLVKAYGDAAKAVLDVCRMEEYVPKTNFTCSVPYALYEHIIQVLNDFGAEKMTQNFLENVTVRGIICEKSKKEAAAKVFDMSSGKCTLQ